MSNLYNEILFLFSLLNLKVYTMLTGEKTRQVYNHVFEINMDRCSVLFQKYSVFIHLLYIKI